MIEPVKNDIRLGQCYKGGDDFGPLWTKQIAIIDKLEEVIKAVNKLTGKPKPGVKVKK